MAKVVITVLASGGLDSTACLNYYLAEGYTVRSLWVDYGQPSALAEESAVEQVTEYYQIPLQKVRISGFNWSDLGNELFEYQGRNLTLVALALNSATVEPGLIALGIHDGTSFADCSVAFNEQLNDLLILLSNGRLRLNSPFLQWSKQNIIEYAISNSVPVDLTYSCERGLSPPCRECVKCRDIQTIYKALQPKSVAFDKRPYRSK